MPKVLGFQLSPKQINALEFMYIHRAVTMTQITRGLGYKNTYTSYKNMYNSILKLKKDKLVDSNPQKNTLEHTFYLTSEGHDLMTRYKGIHPTKKGTGFFHDLGYIPHDLYKYPQKQFSHFKLIVDLSIEVQEFNRLPRMSERKTNIHSLSKSERLSNIRFKVAERGLSNIHSYSRTRNFRLPNNFKTGFPAYSRVNSDVHKVAFRDNLYSAKDFKVKEKNKTIKVKYRPDGELLINDKIYSVEIDRSTERKNALIDKFKGYKRYFDYLTQENQPLPAAIVFVTEERNRDFGLAIRWESISNAFFSGIGDYANQVNLKLITIDKTKQFLLNELSNSLFKLKIGIESLASRGNLRFGKTILRYNGPITNNMYAVNKDNQFYYYFGKVDGFETLGWMRAVEFKKDIDHVNIEENGKVIDNIVPVLFFSDEFSQVAGQSLLAKNKKLFDKTLYFNLKTLEYDYMDIP